MNDLVQAGTLFLIFAGALALYGLLMAKTGKLDLMPYRARHSINGPDDVKRVGREVIKVALVIAVVALLVMAFARSQT